VCICQSAWLGGVVDNNGIGRYGNGVAASESFKIVFGCNGFVFSVCYKEVDHASQNRKGCG
jgi:hypothetical protein